MGSLELGLGEPEPEGSMGSRATMLVNVSDNIVVCNIVNTFEARQRSVVNGILNIMRS